MGRVVPFFAAKNMKVKKHADIKIYGLVQGVMFRFSSRVMAEQRCVFGYAENVADGTVHIEAEGDEDSLNKFIEWCRSGPEDARVKKVEIIFSDSLKNFETFDSRRNHQA